MYVLYAYAARDELRREPQWRADECGVVRDERGELRRHAEVTQLGLAGRAQQHVGRLTSTYRVSYCNHTWLWQFGCCAQPAAVEAMPIALYLHTHIRQVRICQFGRLDDACVYSTW